MPHLTLEGCLIGFSFFCTLQLLALWATRWGDRRQSSKAFVLSILLHMCLGMGATVVSDMRHSANAQQREGSSSPVRELRIETAVRHPENSSEETPVWDQLPQPLSKVFDRSDRENALPQEMTAPSRTTTEIQPLVPRLVAQEDAPTDPATEAAPPLVTAVERPRPMEAVPNVTEIPEEDLPQAESQPDVVFNNRSPQRSRLPSTTDAPRTENAAEPQRTPTRTPGQAPSSPTGRLPGTSDLQELVAGASRAVTDSPGKTSATERAVASAASGGFTSPTGSTQRKSPAAPRPQPDSSLWDLISGSVVDAETGRPLPAAEIRIDQVDRQPFTAISGPGGKFRLQITQLPENFAVTVIREGYLPESRNLKSAQIQKQPTQLNFALTPVTDSVISVEANPAIHHLGNDVFDGAINSRFQREAEGSVLAAPFLVKAAQLQANPPFATASVLVKGMQCQPILRINGTVLPGKVQPSPSDGSFGRCEWRFDPKLLRVGTNQISLQTTEYEGDLDDFEFVNVQIRFAPRQ